MAPKVVRDSLSVCLPALPAYINLWLAVWLSVLGRSWPAVPCCLSVCVWVACAPHRTDAYCSEPLSLNVETCCKQNEQSNAKPHTSYSVS